MISDKKDSTTELWLFLSLLGSSLEPVLVKFYSPAISSLGLIVLKSLVGFILMIPLYGKLRDLPKKELTGLVQVSLLAFITNALIFLSLETLPATILITVITTTPLLVGVINHKKGKIQITPQFILAFAAVFIGIVLTIEMISQSNSKWSQFGLAIAFVSVITSSFYRIKMDTLTQNLNPLTISAFLFAFNGILSILILPFVTVNSKGSLSLAIWLGFAGVMANIAFLYAIKHLGSTRVSVLSIIQRPIAVLLGVVLLNERLSILQATGMLLIFIGIYYAKPKKVAIEIIDSGSNT